MFCLVRTDPDVPKHEGISFVLLTMDQPGVSVKPIRLISGISPFCERFFDNAIAKKEDLIGEVNKGWTVGKRLLQHERSGMSQLVGARRREPGKSLQEVALEGDRAFGDAVDMALATMACHGAIRAGDPLSPDECRALLRSMDAVQDFGGHCPHGRPVVHSLSFSELERRLGR